MDLSSTNDVKSIEFYSRQSDSYSRQNGKQLLCILPIMKSFTSVAFDIL